MLLTVAIAAGVVIVALMDRNRIEPSAATKLKAASRKVDNSAAAVELALKRLLSNATRCSVFWAPVDG